MIKRVKKSKMILDELARITQDQFFVIQEDMATKDGLKELTQNIVTNFATKIDLQDLKVELKNDIQKGTVEVLRAVDKIATKFDKSEKD